MIKKICAVLPARQDRPARRAASVMLAIATVALWSAAPARAEAPGVSAWVKGDHAAARLVAAGPGGPGAALRDVAVELRLAPGYLTYWRQPGDAGLPPTFATAGSANVATVAVDYPAPQLFDEAGAQAFGYKGDVAFPLRLTLADPSRPATLVVALDYAVCATLCLPGHADLRLALPEGPAPEAERLIAAARAKVPKPAPMGAAGSPAIVGIGPGPAGGLAVRARAGGPATLFTEAPEGWFFPAVSATPGADGAVAFTVAPLQRPRPAPAGPLVLSATLVSPEGAVTVPLRVDGGDMDAGAGKP